MRSISAGSETPSARDGYTIEELASDVAAFLDAVGIERATIVGHSFGSFVPDAWQSRTPRVSHGSCSSAAACRQPASAA